MDNKTKETIKGIKYNFIALNCLVMSLLCFVGVLMFTIVNNNREYRKQLDIATDHINSVGKEVDSIAEKTNEINNNVIVSIYQNEDINKKLDKLERR